MRFLLEYKSARQLRLELLKIVVSIVAHFISDADNHELELVNLTYLLGRS